MNEGAQQRETLERIKTQIKRNADIRRERRAVVNNSLVAGSQTFVVSSEESGALDVIQPSCSRDAPFPEEAYSSWSHLERGMTDDVEGSYTYDFMRDPSWLSFNLDPSSATNKPNPNGSTFRSISEYQTHSTPPSIFSHTLDYEDNFLVKYLDYVFPYLFPFFQPSMLDPGRSWILPLVKRSRVAFHSIMGLTSYFFTIAMTDISLGRHEACKRQVWLGVARQADISFEMIQQEISNMNCSGTEKILTKRVQIMGGILQLLIFEANVGRSTLWNVHLAPALSLFEDIFRDHTRESSQQTMLRILDGLSDQALYAIDQSRYVWSPSQAGFRFIIALLLTMDAIGSSCLEQRPRLLDYYGDLLDVADDGSPEFGIVPIRLSAIIGCQNWVIVAIGQIAALDAWKKDMKRSESLSITEVVERANTINRDLGQGISRLDCSTTDTSQENSVHPQTFYRIFPNTSSNASVTPTKIWAYAAQIYLAVVISGWQPLNADVRSYVAKTLELLRTVKNPAHLRSLSWPLCVAGCLAQPGTQEQQFRDLLGGISELNLVGALGDASRIMRNVWQNREALDRKTWDLAACFQSCGGPVLLF